MLPPRAGQEPLGVKNKKSAARKPKDAAQKAKDGETQSSVDVRKVTSRRQATQVEEADVCPGKKEKKKTGKTSEWCRVAHILPDLRFLRASFSLPA